MKNTGFGPCEQQADRAIFLRLMWTAHYTYKWSKQIKLTRTPATYTCSNFRHTPQY
jgi:hypothetical protein